ncbi:MAG: PhnD/SsuA/transferrin family substrate-binding protein [Planctomycetes bacterium]|nr:PhnD/SsuA/transferrin family substrate-binding protein [Planctomycetota bacterium]
MRICRRTDSVAALTAALLLMTGCQATGVAVLNVVGLAEKPLVVTSVAERRQAYDNPLQVLDPFAQVRPLLDALGKNCARAAVPDMCFEFQLAPNLALGTAQLADVSPLHYARLADRTKFQVIAVATDMKGRPMRSAVLVVAADSKIDSIAGLRGKTVAFGPSRDGRTHQAALLLLQDNGLKPQDLSLELFPVPGSLKTFPNAADVLQSVSNASSDAGFVDELAWEELADQPPKLGQPSKSGLRVIGKTIAVPDRLFLRSPTLDDATAAKAAEFLLSAAQKAPNALKPLHYGGFDGCTPEIVDACMKLMSVSGAASAPAERE